MQLHLVKKILQEAQYCSQPFTIYERSFDLCRAKRDRDNFACIYTSFLFNAL